MLKELLIPLACLILPRRWAQDTLNRYIEQNALDLTVRSELSPETPPATLTAERGAVIWTVHCSCDDAKTGRCEHLRTALDCRSNACIDPMDRRKRDVIAFLTRI